MNHTTKFVRNVKHICIQSEIVHKMRHNLNVIKLESSLVNTINEARPRWRIEKVN